MPLATLSSAQLLIVVVGLFVVTIGAGNFLVAPHNRLPSRGGAELPMKSLKGSTLQLELARNEADIRQILMPGGDRKATLQNVADARAGNRGDSVYFIPLYTLSLMVTGLLVARGHAAWVFWLFVGAAAGVAVFDYVENAAIERTLGHIENGGGPEAGDAAAIATPSKVKWVLLTILLVAEGVSAATSNELVVRWFCVVPLAFGGMLGYTLARYFAEVATS